MNLKEMVLAEFDAEMKSTRALLERIPDGKNDFAPHEKSTKLGRLATHVATLPNFVQRVFASDAMDFATVDVAAMRRTIEDKPALLASFDASVKEAQQTLSNLDESSLDKPWTLRQGDHVFFSLPRFLAYRRMMLNHLVHHRAQLSVYLRLLGIPIPGMYGPSADEP